MKCTNNYIKKILLCMLCIAVVFMSGCGSKTVEIDSPYAVFHSALIPDAAEANPQKEFFSNSLCVSDGKDLGIEETDSQVAEAAGLFNLDTREIKYSKNLHERLYPASTTKILTAYIILNNCDLNAPVTVSEEAVTQTSDSSVCGLTKGDSLTIRDLLYGLLLSSGNDAAICLAEYYSGSVELFAEEMNQTALHLGATNSHFVNPNGLPDENHYTTVYDMYLIMQAAISNETFVQIISSESYEAAFHDAAGNPVTKTWNNTNQYLTGAQDIPDGVVVIGGKTGTTNAAGYCLVLYSTNEAGERLVSIVFKADCRSNLYLLMNQILKGFAN